MSIGARPAPSSNWVAYSGRAGVATITLDRPPLNAINSSVSLRLAGMIERAALDADVDAVVIAGTDRAFAVGADIGELLPLDPRTLLEHLPTLQAGLRALADLKKPTVAAIDGHALGGGLELALACDGRVASDRAVLGLPEITLGLIPGGGGTQRLPRLIGPSRAKEMIFTGRPVTALEALSYGLVDCVVPRAELTRRALLVARHLAGPGSVR